MASKKRTPTPALDLGDLKKEPHRFDFYAALRLLDCAHHDHDRPRIGKSQRISDELFRLTQRPSMVFAPSSLVAFGKRKRDLVPCLEVLFFGLFGPNGALPLHLTEYACDRRDHFDDETFSGFADIFHHRMLSLFYRAWADAQPTVNFDRPKEDRFGLYLGALCGLASPAMRDRDEFPDLAKLHHVGLLGCQTRPADGLKWLLEDFLEVPTEIEEFVGEWLEIPEDDTFRLGDSPETGMLGRTTVLGQRVWGRQQRFRIVFGPLDLPTYERLLPGKPSLDRVTAIVRNYVGDEMAWDVNLVLEREHVPPLVLGGEPRLGWTTWLGGLRPDQDARDVVVEPLALARQESESKELTHV